MAAKKPAETSNVSKEDLLHFYREMLLIRRFEEKAGQLYGMGLIGGFCHLYIGQEAVVVGLEAAAKEGDKRITSYRDHGHMLACGMDPKGVMAELTGRSGGYSRGKGGSMHMFSKEKHFYGGHGIVAAQVPLGAGLAFADKYLGNDNVTFTYFGERGAAYGIKGEAVDGMDVLAVKAAGEKAVAICRAGQGPYILEMMTYRYRGHSMSDPAKYRTREEVQKMRDEKDAIEHVRDLLLQGGHATDEDLKAIDRDIKALINESAEFAKESPEPDLSELWTDIYA